MVRFIFPRKLRLLNPAHFAFVFQKPKRTITSQIVMLGRFNSLEYPRIGLVVSRKNVRYAHERNRIKRLVRESFRMHQYKLPHMDFVMIAKKEISLLENHSITEILRTIWNYYYHLSQKP